MSTGDASDQFLVLHRRLLAGDRTASEEVVSLLLGPLTREVSFKFPHMDEEVIWDGVVEALSTYLHGRDTRTKEKRSPLSRPLCS